MRRLFVGGALLGALVGLAAVLHFDPSDVPTDIIGLVRLSLILPVAVFVLWWFIGPGWSLKGDLSETSEGATDPDEIERRIAMIEHTFERSAAPATRHAVRGDEADWYRASMRRDVDAARALDPADWGLGTRARLAQERDASQQS